MRDAFDAVERQLEAYIQSHRVRVHQKEREERQYGKIARILRGDGEYGFLTTPDGREIYFHRNSVLNNRFDFLEVGAEVRFVEELGEEGPQASTVDLVSIVRGVA
jgi:cold shock CspA family protein